MKSHTRNSADWKSLGLMLLIVSVVTLGNLYAHDVRTLLKAATGKPL